MKPDLSNLNAFLAVARAGGFRDGARESGISASRLSDAVRRLESELGVRLFNRTTRSVMLTDAGRSLFDRLVPVMNEMESALDILNHFRDRPAGILRLNVPVSAARLVLPAIIPPFLQEFPDIQVEIATEEGLIDIFAAGFDAGIRYEERLEQDVIALPIGPRWQSYALGASQSYLDKHGRPEHPRDLLQHMTLRTRFAGRAMSPWEFERDGVNVVVDPPARLVAQAGGGVDLVVDAAIRGAGIVALFEDWLRPHFQSGALIPVLEPWWLRFSGPFLYYSGRRLVPAPLRAFIDFVKALPSS